MVAAEITEQTGQGSGPSRLIWDLLETVMDPEIPVLSIVDLGMARDVRVSEGRVEIVITPTYTGCPAMDMIETDIQSALAAAGIAAVTVTTVLSPAWTTDWMSEAGRRKLTGYGIAPPAMCTSKSGLLGRGTAIACPRCDSDDTECVSQFGSTACKAHYRCRVCREPFDYFKCL